MPTAILVAERARCCSIHPCISPFGQLHSTNRLSCRFVELASGGEGEMLLDTSLYLALRAAPQHKSAVLPICRTRKWRRGRDAARTSLYLALRAAPLHKSAVLPICRTLKWRRGRDSNSRWYRYHA